MIAPDPAQRGILLDRLVGGQGDEEAVGIALLAGGDLGQDTSREDDAGDLGGVAAGAVVDGELGHGRHLLWVGTAESSAR